MGMLEALQIMLQVCSIIFNIVVVLLAIEGKEVAVQDDADAFQQARVDSLALEDVYTLVRSQCNLSASQLTPRSWRSSSALISLPMCIAITVKPLQQQPLFVRLVC